MMTVATLLLALVAFAQFALATDEHHRHRIGHRPTPRVRARLRTGAWLALVTSFPAAIVARGWVFGPVFWIAAVMLAAGAVFLAVNLIPVRHAAPHKDTAP